MCNAIKSTPETIEGFHPIYATTTFPSPYERPLRRGYNTDLKPVENLSQKLSSGKKYGYRPSGFKPRDSFVYKSCMSAKQKALVDEFVDTMRHCNSGNFDIYIEKIGAGLNIQGDNGRNCQALGNALLGAHLQGYQPSLLDKVNSVVGSGNRLRSPTGEDVFNCYENVSAIGCGTNKDAFTPFSGDLVEWADRQGQYQQTVAETLLQRG